MANLSDNYVLCFDVRSMGGEDALDWSTERKLNFLYRLDINYPISTDRHVLDTLDSRFYSADSVGYTGPFSPLWENLDKLRIFVDSLKITTKDHFFLSICLDISLLTTDDLKYWNKLLGNNAETLLKSKLFENLATPNRVQECWKFVGYDVSDSGFTSAISNMGFTSGDNVPSLRAKWGPCLNEYHLFDQAENALRFKEFSNQRVPEHAPFFVFGLWFVSGEQ